MDEISTELICSICDQQVTFYGLTGLRLEHAMNVWATQHRHTVAERAEYRAYLKSLNE